MNNRYLLLFIACFVCGLSAIVLGWALQSNELSISGAIAACLSVLAIVVWAARGMGGDHKDRARTQLQAKCMEAFKVVSDCLKQVEQSSGFGSALPSWAEEKRTLALKAISALAEVALKIPSVRRSRDDEAANYVIVNYTRPVRAAEEAAESAIRAFASAMLRRA
jgi:hypothetical protein